MYKKINYFFIIEKDDELHNVINIMITIIITELLFVGSGPGPGIGVGIGDGVAVFHVLSGIFHKLLGLRHPTPNK